MRNSLFIVIKRAEWFVIPIQSTETSVKTETHTGERLEQLSSLNVFMMFAKIMKSPFRSIRAQLLKRWIALTNEDKSVISAQCHSFFLNSYTGLRIKLCLYFRLHFWKTTGLLFLTVVNSVVQVLTGIRSSNRRIETKYQSYNEKLVWYLLTYGDE